MIKKILNWLFPIVFMVSANKKLNNEIEELKAKTEQDDDYLSEYMEDFQSITTEEAKNLFDQVISTRKTIEEKAKGNILIVTIAVSVILGLTGYLFGMQDKINSNFALDSILAILFSLCLVYLTMGSILSIATLNRGELNQTYDFSSADYKYLSSLEDDQKEKETKYFLSKYSELNIKVNLKINNYVSGTYSFLMNSLITLCIIGVISCILYVFQTEKDNKTETELEEQQTVLEDINSNLINIGKNIKDVDQNDEEDYNDLLELLKETINIFNKNMNQEGQK
ncbi:hypothetical protein MKY20_14745 [Cytobacillus sp. FSL W8-0315]|uniref:hypothetical protein n=1 Tax=Cytobacillus sp. FSL W8-0315 TaxID=2921600 RepID=UPI0030F92CBB